MPVLRIDGRQAPQGFIERQQINLDLLASLFRIGERHLLLFAAALGRAALPQVINEQVVNQFRGEAEKLRAVFETELLFASQSQIGFVDERGGLKHYRVRLSAQVASGQLAKLLID